MLPTLCNPVDYSLPGSSVHGVLQARTLAWVAIPFSWVGGWGNLPEPGVKPGSSALQTNSSPSEPPSHLEKETILTAKMLPPTVRCDLTSRLWSPRSGPALFGFWGRNKCEAGQGCPSQVTLHDNSFCELTGSSCHMSCDLPSLTSLQHPHLPPWRQLLSSNPISTLSRLLLGEKYGRRSPWRFD